MKRDRGDGSEREKVIFMEQAMDATMDREMNRETDRAKLADMNDLINSSVRIFGRIKKEFHFHRRYERHLWTSAVDAEQMEHVLVNLYVSAWQAMRDGGDIYLETENVRLDEHCAQTHNVPSGSYVKISVSATNTDMGEAAKHPFFGPFFTTKENGRMRVLGLTSAYEIVKSHGGFSKVYSDMGKGTTVSFFLPASRGKAVKQTQLPVLLHKGSERTLVMEQAALPAYDIAM
jgi:two-component system cell cycle sensor histidine kinase/response regulator CckA